MNNLMLKDTDVSLIWSYENKQLFPSGSTCGVYNGLLPWNSKDGENTGSNESLTIDLSSYNHSACLISIFDDNTLNNISLDIKLSIANLTNDDFTQAGSGIIGPIFRLGLHYFPFRLNQATIKIDEISDDYGTGAGVTYNVNWSVLLLS